MGKKENVEKVLSVFAEKPSLALQKADKRREEVYLRVPEIKQIDEKLKNVGIRVFLETEKKEGNLAARIEKMRRDNASLNKKREELLVKNGFPADYTRPQYECSKCGDTGYVGINMCDCLKRAIILENYKTSGIGGLLIDQTFDNFSLDMYSAGENRSAMSEILTGVKKYAENFNLADKPSSLLFLGATGLGKTHLSSAVARVILEKGYEVVYESAPNIMYEMEKERFSYNSNLDIDRYFNADFLIIDDLGTEFRSKLNASGVYNLINTRLLSGKPTLISTNLTPKEIEKEYEPRVFSRLFGSFDLFYFRGEDVRRKKIENR